MNTKTILMKVTSRGRPSILLETITQYVSLANNTNDMVWLFTFDADDRTCFDIDDKIKKIIKTDKYIISKQLVSNANKIEAINRDINELVEPKWDILLNISDDQRPIRKGYDDLIRNAMPNHLDASLWFWDGHQNRINTQEIVGKAYYDRFKSIYYNEYKSFFCDNEATEVALALDKFVRSPICIIKHFHPQWMQNKGPIPQDELYKRNDKYWTHDEALYKSRKQFNFK